MRSAIARSTGVLVGDLNTMVSEMIAAASKAGQLFTWHHAPLEKHAGNNCAGAADGFVSDIDRRVRLHFREAVVVDNLKNLRLLQPRYGLMKFVVVDEHDRRFLLGRSRWKR